MGLGEIRATLFPGGVRAELRDGPKVVTFLVDYVVGTVDVSIRRVDDPENARVSARVPCGGLDALFTWCARAGQLLLSIPAREITAGQLAGLLGCTVDDLGGPDDATIVVDLEQPSDSGRDPARRR